MNVVEFIILISSVMLLVLIGLGYLAFSGRLKWVQKVPAQLPQESTETFGIKELTADEILAFANFVFRDFQSMERGARLANVQVFVEKGLIIAKHVDGFLQIELTEKGKQIHDMINVECEKRLMIAPQTEMMWKTLKPKPAKTMVEKLESRMNIR